MVSVMGMKLAFVCWGKDKEGRDGWRNGANNEDTAWAGDGLLRFGLATPVIIIRNTLFLLARLSSCISFSVAKRGFSYTQRASIRKVKKVSTYIGFCSR